MFEIYSSIGATLFFLIVAQGTWAQLINPNQPSYSVHSYMGNPMYQAIARMRTADNSEFPIGQVNFFQYAQGYPVIVTAMLQLSYNQPHDQYLALHVHEMGDISENCKWVGGDWNPGNRMHGGPSDHMRHDGDLGNVVPMGNTLLVNITDYFVQLTGPNSIVGRSLVLHVQRDDYGRGGTTNSLLDGNSGVPLACGVIGIKGAFSPGAGVALRPSLLTISTTCCLLFAILTYLFGR